MQLPIKTRRLSISEYTGSMAESMRRISLDEDNRLFLPDEVFETVDDAEKTLTALISNYGRKNAPLVYPILLADGTHIGHVEAVPLKGGGWEAGYHIAKERTGKGYATEALRAFLAPIMERLGIERISGVCRADNIASRKVLEKCGFVLTAEKMASYHGEEHLLCYYQYEHKAVEEMTAFFDARADGYNSHMLSSADWQYRRLADALPVTGLPLRALDIGCGTGIELDSIWASAPNAHVVCVDLSREMLGLLLRNHPDHHSRITVVEASYVDWAYPENAFDLVVSNQTMHHFQPETKAGVYRKIFRALKPGGVYIEGDFMADEARAKQYQRRYEALTANLPAEANPGKYHIDIPLTVETQTRLLSDAGFHTVEVLTSDIREDWSYAVLRAAKEILKQTEVTIQ